MVATGGAAKRDAAISQLRRGVIEFCVLALLADEERYGFELVQKLAGEEALVTTEGTLYPLLGRLQARGRRGDDLAGVAGRAPPPLLPADPRREEIASGVRG